jgi:holo-[acyl-carrier-protein] synthase
MQNIRFPLRFAEYFLTPSEVRAFKRSADPTAFLASRFAAKEATIKAFPGHLGPHDFEIVKDGKKPAVRFASPTISDRYAALVSLAHSTRYAAGYATVMEK